MLIGLVVLPLMTIANPVIDNHNGFAFKEMMGPFKFYRKLDFNDSRLGYGLNYKTAGSSAERSLVTVIFYDLGLKDIENGVKDARVIKQFENAFKDVRIFVTRGNYRSVKILKQSTVKDDNYLVLNMIITAPSGLTLKSSIFMRGQNGKFVKIRVSGPNNEESDKLMLKVVKEISLVLGIK